MRPIIKTLSYVILIAIFMSSCKKELFSGKDNTISSFQINKGDMVFKGSISANEIVITAPENFSLKDAKPILVLSEKATIQPDPNTITDWDVPQTFTVTSKNGTQKTYHYSVTRNIISKDGDITLITQADVNALAALGISKINGNLTIGNPTGTDSISSLAPLTGLKTIAYALIINPTYSGKNLTGLENLEKVGALQIGANTKLKTVELQNLKSIMGDFTITKASLKVLNFPALLNIDKNMQFANLDSLTSIQFPKLTTILQNFAIGGSSFIKNNSLKAVDLPSLQNIGGTLAVTNCKALEKIQFPVLTKCESVSFNSFPLLNTLTLPLLQSTNGNVELSNNQTLKTLDFSSLKNVGGVFNLSSTALTNLDGLKSLTSVGNSFNLTSNNLLTNVSGLKNLATVDNGLNLSSLPAINDNLAGLSSLKKVGGQLTIADVPFTSFNGFALTEVGSLSINGNNIASISNIDVSKFNIVSNLNLSNITSPFKLKGKDINTSSLNISACNINLDTDLEGFKEVNDFTYVFNTGIVPVNTQTINLKKVNGNFTITAAGFNSINLPSLLEVTGVFNLTISSKMAFNMPILKKVGRSTIILQASNMELFSLPSLQYVDGDFSLTTGNTNTSVGNIQMPALKTINGRLTLKGQAATAQNTKMTNLDGFSALTSVTGITVSFNQQLSDYSGLKNCIGSIGASSWITTGNLYNPTYQDMMAGKYVKP